jgi:hypothetical protein
MALAVAQTSLEAMMRDTKWGMFRGDRSAHDVFIKIVLRLVHFPNSATPLTTHHEVDEHFHRCSDGRSHARDDAPARPGAVARSSRHGVAVAAAAAEGRRRRHDRGSGGTNVRELRQRNQCSDLGSNLCTHPKTVRRDGVRCGSDVRPLPERRHVLVRSAGDGVRRRALLAVRNPVLGGDHLPAMLPRIQLEVDRLVHVLQLEEKRKWASVIARYRKILGT